MKYIDKILNGREVVWRTLGEVAEYEQPAKYLVKSTNYNDSFGTPVLTAGKTFILGYTNETDGIYRASEKNVIIFDDFTTSNKWVDFDFKVKSSAMKIITSRNENEVLLKYIYYWLNTLPNEFVYGDHKRHWISNFSLKLIPIPPRDVQEEIVEVLDKFTELERELERELELRLKQYEYYRNKLLTFDDDKVQWRPLGEVAEIRGRIGFRGYTRKDIVEKGQGAISLSPSNIINQSLNLENPTYISWYKYEESPEIMVNNNDIILTKTASVGKATIIKELREKATINPQLVLLKNIKCNPSYLYYYIIDYKFQRELLKLSGTGSVPNVTQKNIAQLLVPIPAREEQERIVEILDKFDKLVNSLSEGLPREIELRRKQYEYYRNELLTFN